MRYLEQLFFLLFNSQSNNPMRPKAILVPIPAKRNKEASVSYSILLVMPGVEKGPD